MRGRRAGTRRERLREHARAPETGTAELVRLSRCRYWDVKRIVAARSDLPALGIIWSVHSSAWSVRAAIARRDDLVPKVTRALTADIPPVRLVLAANSTIDTAAACLLVRDYDLYVSGVAAGNPQLTVEAIRAFAHGMRRPAWALRRAATNPTCPEDLQDEILTWLAIGGAGRGDPLFDPIACTGDPGDGTEMPYQWYRDAIAGTGLPAHHPLWAARAGIRGLNLTLPHSQLHDLSVDEADDVRLAAARFKYRKTLAVLATDEDEAVREQARLTLGNTPRRATVQRWPARAALGAFVVLALLRACTGLGDTPNAHSRFDVNDFVTTPTTPASSAPARPPVVFGYGYERAPLPSNPTSQAIAGGVALVATVAGSAASTPPETVLRIIATGREAIAVDGISAIVPAYGEVRDAAVSPFSVAPGTSRTLTITGSPQPTAFLLSLLGPAGTVLVPAAGPDSSVEGNTP